VAAAQQAAAQSTGVTLRAAVLPGAILMLITLLVVPIPTLLLDLFFIVNILVSLLVLMIALGAKKPLDFSSFPTVLLFATLLRLALNVASTRVVLMAGHEGTHAAGQVIEAFGAFLIAGNYVVGLLVFAILMIINLVVITKGAGRISEVSARFTLDALPGKQMAIDADLAAGILTSEEAKARRQEVATEADFYGAMDGASKFVKGDAVAALLVLFINVFGGLAVGVLQHDLSFADAAATYIILAIGDGLVAQVPALLLSIAAAVIVTRVNSAHDLAGQLTAEFRHAGAWAPAAVVLAILALLPGMPHLILIGFAAVAGFAAYKLSHPGAATPIDETLTEATAPTAEEAVGWDDVVDHVQLNVDIGFGLLDLVNPAKGAPLVGRITGIRRQHSQRFGFLVPPVRIRDSLDLPAGGYRIALGSEVLGEGELAAGRLLALDPGGVSDPVEGAETIDPAFGLPARWIDVRARDEAIAAGYTVVDTSTVLATHLSRLLGGSMHLLLGQEETARLVETLGAGAPKLAANLMPGAVSLQLLTGVLQRLLEEGVPIRDFRRIAEALCTAATRSQDPAQLAEAARRALGPLIVQGVAGVDASLPVVTFGARLERLLTDAIGSETENAHLAIDPGLGQQIVAAVTATARELADRELRFAIVTTPRLRRAIFMLLRHHVPDLAVLSFDEVPEARGVEVVSVIEPANTEEVA
jgi:flagellar biosynthesis protein FlhA